MGMESAAFPYCTSVSVTRNKLYGVTMHSGYNYGFENKKVVFFIAMPCVCLEETETG
jgi:hypothetical protein